MIVGSREVSYLMRVTGMSSRTQSSISRVQVGSSLPTGRWQWATVMAMSVSSEPPVMSRSNQRLRACTASPPSVVLLAPPRTSFSKRLGLPHSSCQTSSSSVERSYWIIPSSTKRLRRTLKV